ncbi:MULTISPECIES: recombinase family protein [Bacteroides]|jgi:DNA invertase Pin-like site-specific DNA recombinase|uniref:recombinase family protein n=1 Tax=Bacteroides TaxID=816 RepID=UPI0011070A22|nr:MULTISPECIES: recombinase family protein [Bacteroides]MBV4189498.1 recombinase family protein [Bacteroides fragilis]MDC1837662.1 recombinase family protein [Bacteroides uniformis]MDC1862898.1 recombinase family protein [Bacteroides uniformis]MDC1869130.1 recombinase family protein [Bacteroides uniformis]
MKFVAYYRVSTKRQNLGLVAQRNTVLNYINSVGGKLINTYEEKESGKCNNRIELSKAIDYCKVNNATLVIAKLDRLSRNVSFIFALKDANIKFYCCDIPELSTLTLGIFATIAQSERETISSRTKAALKAKKDKGIKLGAPNATISNDMRIKSAEALKRKADNNTNNKRAYTVISSLIERNMTLQYIASYLNQNDFRTSKNCLFTPIAVSRLIKRYKK